MGSPSHEEKVKYKLVTHGWLSHGIPKEWVLTEDSEGVDRGPSDGPCQECNLCLRVLDGETSFVPRLLHSRKMLSPRWKQKTDYSKASLWSLLLLRPLWIQIVRVQSPVPAGQAWFSGSLNFQSESFNASRLFFLPLPSTVFAFSFWFNTFRRYTPARMALLIDPGEERDGRQTGMKEKALSLAAQWSECEKKLCSP